MTESRDEVDNNHEVVERQMAGMRLIIQALFMALVLISGILIFSATRMKGPVLTEPIVPFVFLGIAIVGVIAARVGADKIIKQLRNQIAPESSIRTKLDLYKQDLFLTIAPLEGAGAFLLIGFLLVQEPWLLIPVPFLLAMLILRMPSVEKFESWCHRQSL